MAQAIGILALETISAGLVRDNRVAGSLSVVRPASDGGEGDTEGLAGVPVDGILDLIVQAVMAVEGAQSAAAIGLGVPGVVRDGMIIEAPNLQQLKGLAIERELGQRLRARGITAPVVTVNDADAMAAGIAGSRMQLERLTRIWMLAGGIGYGRYPWSEGFWEGGHSVVTLDPKERFCGCGGIGHLEGVLGYRAMRLRFLDLEPEEVFENARAGDARCLAFFKQAHRALAAATATVVHMEGPGKFYLTGPTAQFVDLTLLNHYLHEMVRMSSLQGSVFERVETTGEMGVLGAAVSALRRSFT
ncbi:MAG: ROK family protein [Acidobacteria bacterium]|nr:ROK family protein [Acidobacteriota bacterium]